MKALLPHLFALAFLAGLPLIAFAQGSLNPPGAPAPTMKSLQQVEPRTPISSGLFTITAPGSYYLTQSITPAVAGGDAIRINADNVTLDLNGFTISSIGGTSLSIGILIQAGRHNIVIKNGIISGQTVVTPSGNFPNRTWSVVPLGFTYGVFSSSNSAGVQLHNVKVSGCQLHGALLQGPNNIVSHCSFHNNGDAGISAFYASISHCASSLNYGNGFHVPFSSISHSMSNDNRLNGFLAPVSSVTHCQAMQCGSHGINASNSAVAFSVTGNTASPGITGSNVVQTGNRSQQ